MQDLRFAAQRMVGFFRGIVTGNSGQTQMVQAQFSQLETLENVPRIGEYGFNSHPPDGFVGVGISPSGDRSATIIIATEHGQYRMRLEKGEVSLADDQGQYVYLHRGGISLKDKAGSTVDLNGDGTIRSKSATWTHDGQLHVTQQITGAGGLAISGGSGATVVGNLAVSSGDVTADGIGLKTHTHGGVQSGGDSTGTPQG